MAHFSFPSFRPRPVGLWAIVLALLALSVAGCVSLLEPRTSDATYYLLDRAEQASPGSADTTGLSVGLRQPRLAPYLDPARIVIRRGPHRITFSEFHRWGEDLDRGISRTVARGLEARSDIHAVDAVPWPKSAVYDYIVELEVLRFEGVGPPPDPTADKDAPPPKGHSQMTVQWTIRPPEDDTVLVRKHTHHRTEGWRVDDYEALVGNLGRGLNVLVDEVGTQLHTLDRP